MRVAVWGGMHGPPELTGLQTVDRLRESPIPNVDTEIANEMAIGARDRYVATNLALAFPGNMHASDYETVRAAHLLAKAKSYDAVLDVHDSPGGREGEYVLLGKDSNPRLLGAAALLGIGNVIISKPSVGHYSDYAPNVMAIEMTRGTAWENIDENALRIISAAGALAVRDELPDVNTDEFTYYRRLTEIRAAEADDLGLQRYEGIQPFDQLPIAVNIALGTGPELLYADSWNGVNSSEGEYFGGVLLRIDNPFEPST